MDTSARYLQRQERKVRIMHEGAVCAEIMDVVSAAAVRNGLKRIDEIMLTVGPYAGLQLDQLNVYFNIARENTCMARAFIGMEQDDTITGTRQMFIRSIRGE